MWQNRRHFPNCPYPKDAMSLHAHTRRLPAATALLAVSLAASACSGGSSEAAVAKTTTSSTTSTTVVTTTSSSTTSTTAKPILPGLGRGAKGPEVVALEQRLTGLHYDAGKVDGTFDATTAFAVMAFQKVNGLPRTGRATKDVTDLLQTAGDPPAMLAGGGANRVEVDLKRQVLFLYKGGALLRILPVSTGSGKRYCVDGQCAMAVTPGGSFKIGRKISGVRVSRLGQLYNPLYFNGGIAIHGAPSVPAGPASHGCVRIPMSASRWFFDTVPSGTPVYVLGGRTAPVPFNEPAPGEAPPTSSTTTAKPTTTTTPTTVAPTTSSTTSTTLTP
jgi:peptidoglycan hydrolase-like protein with peptidoglycan-binding domain